MPRSFEPNQSFFDNVLRSPAVERIVDDVAARTLTNAQSGAWVDTGAYKDGFHIEHHESAYRRVAQVVGSDEKTMLLESKSGNLARALKAAKR